MIVLALLLAVLLVTGAVWLRDRWLTRERMEARASAHLARQVGSRSWNDRSRL